MTDQQLGGAIVILAGLAVWGALWLVEIARDVRTRIRRLRRRR